MKQLKYLCIMSVAFAFSCVTKTQLNIDEESYEIYSKIIYKCASLENKPWFEQKIPDRFSSGDSLKLYLKYRDSIKAYYKKKIFYVLIHDTTIDITDEMQVLKYSINNNKFFFKEYLNGDSSFKNFILEWKPLEAARKKIIIDKLKPTFQYRMSNEISKNENDFLLANITFSDIAFDKTHTKAILYLVDGSGVIYFVEKINNQWVIKGTIVSWQE